jgi:hypothetical protein
VSIALTPGNLHPEDALALVEPERREFAVLWAEGKVGAAELCKTADISTATYYRWIKDERIVAYADAIGRSVGARAKRRLHGEVDNAIDNMIAIQTDPTATPTMLKASLEILDRAGVTRQETTKAGVGGGDTVVQVNLSIPINADARDEQEERRRRRELRAQEATFVDVTDE